MLKAQQQPHSLTLDNLSDTPEVLIPEAPIVQAVPEQTALPEVAPHSSTIIKSAGSISSNSRTPIAKRLTGLTTDEMLHTVLSNSFVPDIVTQNTIIWDNWDIFSKTKYLWKVVRKRPDWVKLWVSNKCYFFVCRPMTRKKNCYEALLYRIVRLRRIYMLWD